MTDTHVVIIHVVISIAFWWSMIHFLRSRNCSGYVSALWLVGAAAFWFAFLIIPGCYIPVAVAMYAASIHPPTVAKQRFSLVRILVVTLTCIAIGDRLCCGPQLRRWLSMTDLPGKPSVLADC